MNEKPLVSIIIPTYNRTHLIEETIDSVLVQIYTNWECVIVDDRSSGNTDEVVEKYVKKTIGFSFINDQMLTNSEETVRETTDLKLEEEEYVNWFDSDDVVQPILSQLKSKYLACYMMAKFYKSQNNQKGFLVNREMAQLQLKYLLENKNYSFVIGKIIKSEYDTLDKKNYFLWYHL